MTTFTTNEQNALSAAIYRPARFVTITFSDYTFRVWSGIGPKTVNSHTYTGVGSLGSIQQIAESSADGVTNINSQRLSLSLTGLDASLMTDLRDYNQQGVPVEILEALLDADGAVIDGTYSLFVGQLDVMSFVAGQALTITATCENFLSFAFHGPNGRRRTHADQNEIFNDDFAFEWAASLPTSIPWGITPQSVPRDFLGFDRDAARRAIFG